MSDGASDRGSIDAPFEWLTNFRSLRHLVLPSRVAFGRPPSSRPSRNLNGARPESNDYYDRRPDPLNALHVGCGTSAAGESLLRLRERAGGRRGGALLRYGNVVNVDNDARALDGMRRRWEGRRRTEDRTGASSGGEEDDDDAGMGEMEWVCLDFGSDESCRSAMDGVYRRLARRVTVTGATRDELPGGCFDLVLDKSTLDCLLCAETTVVARFLCEVYRALGVPTCPPPLNSDRDVGGASSECTRGGVYVLVSFHPAEFVEKLLKRLPGANWHVEHEIVRREVEDLTLENGV